MACANAFVMRASNSSAPVVQRIECRPPKPDIVVQFHAGAFETWGHDTSEQLEVGAIEAPQGNTATHVVVLLFRE